jgi:hypothetical protein
MPKAARARVASPNEIATVQGLSFKTPLNPPTKLQWVSGVLQSAFQPTLDLLAERE